MDMQALVVGVEEYLQQQQTRYVDELREICAIDSDSHNKEGLDTMVTYLAARMRGLGMDVTIVEQEQWGNDLIGTLQGEGEGCVLLLGHIDTVYPVGTAARRPVRVENDIVYGPGVIDMKGGILLGFYAIEAMLALSYRAFGEIRFLCVSDEEVSVRHSLELMRHACMGCNGALVLEAARANGDIVSARKGNAWYTLTAQGRAAHAGVEPEKGRNAIREIAHQTLQLTSINEWREGISINAGSISGGTTPNVVPESAMARFDLRFLHTEDRLATEALWHELLKKHCVADVETTLMLEPDSRNPMALTPASQQLVMTAKEIATTLGFSLHDTTTGGASDGSFVSDYGVPTLDGLGPIGGRDHSPYEYLLLNSIVPRAALLAGLIAHIGASPEVL
ncbi:MAG: M20 family metallopeptidase [Ktedonobacteraceae bacterium]